MNYIKKLTIAVFCVLLLASVAPAQINTMTATTLSAAIDNKQQSFAVASATGIGNYPNLQQSQGAIGSSTGNTLTQLVVDKEVMEVVSVTSTTVTVRRGRQGSKQVAHLSGAKVWVGPPAFFTEYDRTGVCVTATELVLPLVNRLTGKAFQCTNGRWTGLDQVVYVPPTQCTWVPTTLTQTSTYTFAGASNLFVLKGISNAAAGTMTLVCNIMIPSSVTIQKGAVLTDITLFLASSATGSGVVPTSVGTSTLGSITFPAAATTETASTVTPVTIGGTVTTTGAGATGFLTAVTTDGAFYTIKHTYSTVVDLSTDLRILQYTFPVLQSAASVSTLFTPGLELHYRVPE